MLKVKYEEMYPDEFLAAVEKTPVFIVPTGLLEWHGDHLPLGQDTMKAYGICLEVAKKLGGGIVLPPNYYGRPGFSTFVGTLTYSEKLITMLFAELFGQLKKVGAKVIMMITGHYGPCQVDLVKKIAQDFMAANLDVKVIAQPEYEGITFYRSGDVPMNSAYNETVDSELGTLILLSFAIVAIIAMTSFRMRFFGLVGPLMVVLLGLILTVGFMGVMGYNMDFFFLMTPTLLTAVGVAQSVHLISEYQICQANGLPRREAIRQTLEHVGVPCLLAALTTAVGFWAMSISKLKAISDLAVYLGVGVLLAFALSITVLCCMLAFGRKKQGAGNNSHHADNGPLSRILKWIIDCNLKHTRAILIISAAIFIFSFIGMGQLKVGFNFLEEFKEKVEFRRATHYIEEVMGGILSVVYVFDTGKPDGIKDSEVLKQLERLQIEADQNPLVRKTYSIVDVLKDINQSFHGGDPAYYKLPEDRALISQYLLMYEMAGGKELEDYVTGDYARTSLELRIDMTDSFEVQGLIDMHRQ